jgi:hypothetical protein
VRLARAIGFLLFVFHVVIFTADVARGRLLDPLVTLRWATAIVLFGVLVALWQVGVSLLWSRRAAVFWLLVFFLHATAHVPAATGETIVADGAAGGAVLVVLPALVTGIAMVGLRLLSPFHRGPASRPRPAGGWCLVAVAPVPCRRQSFDRVLAPRPPPFY